MNLLRQLKPGDPYGPSAATRIKHSKKQNSLLPTLFCSIFEKMFSIQTGQCGAGSAPYVDWPTTSLSASGNKSARANEARDPSRTCCFQMLFFRSVFRFNCKHERMWGRTLSVHVRWEAHSTYLNGEGILLMSSMLYDGVDCVT